jgi:hypothetical protein
VSSQESVHEEVDWVGGGYAEIVAHALAFLVRLGAGLAVSGASGRDHLTGSV